MFTRAQRTEGFEQQVDEIIHKEVYFEIKWDSLCPGDGDFPADPNPEEKAHVEKLKTDCYTFAAQEFKKIGALSSQPKKDIIRTNLLRMIDMESERIDSYNNFFRDPTRMSRSVVEISVLRALLNGLQKAKLSDGGLGAFDDA